MKKVILVTGGSRGIGRQIVKSLAKKDNQIILNYFQSQQQAEEIQEELRQNGIEIQLYKANVADYKQVKEMIQFCLEKYKRIDVLINNAGISQIKLLTETTLEDWNMMFQTNVSSVFYTCKEVIPNMVHNKQGCIINISSIWGQEGASCEVAYSASKSAVNGFTKALAKELGPSNIRVNAIAPGYILTDMNSRISEQEKEELKQEIPLQRLGNPQDISRCIEWLVEEEYTTGQIIGINGGWNI